MTSTAAAPLPVLYLPPPDPGMLADLLLHEVAACVAAVGHRLHVLPRSFGSLHEAVAEFAAGHGRTPVMVVTGHRQAGPDAPPSAGDVPVVTVTLDGTGPAEAGSSTLTLPTRTRSLCRVLARGADPQLPGRALVLSHHGAGPGGDDDWPGLSWGLTLLLGGPGRGVLLDLRGPDGGLGSRLRATSEPLRPDLADPGSDPAPGPALAARLPAAGGVRWWSLTGSLVEQLPAIGTAIDTFHWTVLDAGRNAQLAGDLAAQGLPVLAITERDGACCLEPVEQPASRTADRLLLDPFPWTGSTPASWARAARRRASIDLTARLAPLLSGPSREPAEAGR